VCGRTVPLTKAGNVQAHLPGTEATERVLPGGNCAGSQSPPAGQDQETT